MEWHSPSTQRTGIERQARVSNDERVGHRKPHVADNTVQIVAKQIIGVIRLRFDKWFEDAVEKVHGSVVLKQYKECDCDMLLCCGLVCCSFRKRQKIVERDR